MPLQVGGHDISAVSRLLPPDAPAKEYFNRRLMEGTQNRKKTLSSLFCFTVIEVSSPGFFLVSILKMNYLAYENKTTLFMMTEKL